MPPKRPSPMEEPPSASSSSEEEETDQEQEQEQEQESEQQQEQGQEQDSSEGDEGEEEEGSDEEETEDEEEEQQPQQTQRPNKLSSPPPKKPEQQQQKQPRKPESETESGSETESESDDRVISAKPISSKAMEETKLNKKVSSESPAKKPEPAKSAKRGGEEIEKEKNKDSKRSKKENSGIVPVTPATSSPGDAKKNLFQRLWSEDDEIVILKGIIEFKEKKGVDVTKDMGAFYEFIKKSLDCDGTLAQMKDKISRLRRKFEKSVQRGKQGENKKFSRDHDQLLFDLSKKIWGSERVGGVEAKVNGKAKKSLDLVKAELGVGKEREGEKRNAVKFDKGLVRVGGMEEYVVKRGLDAIGATKRAEMEEKWRKLHAEELELFLKRNELVREQAKLMLAAYKTEEDEDE